MSQSKIGSLIESLMNTLSGFVVAWGVWEWVVGPLFQISTSARQGFWVTMIFTVVSIIRCYIWRRVFNRREQEWNSIKNIDPVNWLEWSAKKKR